MRIAIGSDEFGFALKEAVRGYLEREVPSIEVVDFGVDREGGPDYADVGFRVSEAVAAGEFDRAILVCGTGIGMSIVANKAPGVRAALCHDIYSAERARKSNNAQVLAMGGRIIGAENAMRIVAAWLASDFEHGRSEPKVAKIVAYEQRLLPTTANE